MLCHCCGGKAALHTITRTHMYYFAHSRQQGYSKVPYARASQVTVVQEAEYCACTLSKLGALPNILILDGVTGADSAD